MKIQMTKSVAGRRTSYSKGEVHDVDGKLGRAFVGAGAAIAVETGDTDPADDAKDEKPKPAPRKSTAKKPTKPA